jgi:hypothetical protein
VIGERVRDKIAASKRKGLWVGGLQKRAAVPRHSTPCEIRRGDPAALSERDYVHQAIDRADLIIAIGHDTVEKPPFIMGPPHGPTVLHVGYLPRPSRKCFFRMRNW